MPSLPADICKYSPRDSFRNYLPKQDNLTVKHGLLFIAWILFKITIASIILMLPWYWLNYYICVEIDVYKDHKLYLSYEAYRGLIWYLFIGFICFQSCRFTYIYSLVIPTNGSDKYIDKYPKQFMFIIIWCISLIIQTCGLCITSYVYHNFGDNNSFHNNYHNKYVLHLFCSVSNCKNEHIYHFYQFVFGFPVNIFLSITLNHLCYIIYHCNYNKSHSHSQSQIIIEKAGSNSGINTDALLMDVNKSNSSIISDNKHIGSYLSQYNKLYEHSCWIITQKYYAYIVLYSFILLIFLFILYLTISVKSIYFDDYYLEVTIVLQAEGYIFNFLLKRIARSLDILRMQKPRNIFMNFESSLSKSHNNDEIESGSIDISKQNEHRKLSLEVMTQSFVRLVYWIEYRYITIYDQPTWTAFWGSKGLHFMNLIWIVSIRPSKLYFNKSDNFMKSIINYKSTPNILKWCLSFFDTKSNSSQWTERSAIDTMLRFMNAIGSTVVISILLYFGQDDWYENKHHDWRKAILLTLIGAGLEIFVYFPYTILSYRCLLKHELIQPFFRFYLYNRNKFIYCSAVLFACAACILPVREIIKGPGAQ